MSEAQAKSYLWRLALRARDRAAIETVARVRFPAGELSYLGPSAVDPELSVALIHFRGAREAPSLDGLDPRIEVRVWSQRELLQSAQKAVHGAELNGAEAEREWFSSKAQTQARKFALQQADLQKNEEDDPTDWVSKTNRYASGKLTPRGHGWVARLGQSNVLRDPELLDHSEICQLLQTWHSRYPQVTGWNHLPQKTHEGREVQILRVGERLDKSLPAVAIVAGGHFGGDWITVNAVLGAMSDFLDAVHSDHDLSYKHASWDEAPVFPNEHLRAVFQKLNLLFVPVFNPDGYEHSLKHDRGWVRNRRRTGKGADAVGVHVNRNTDFLFHYKTKLGGLQPGQASVSDDLEDWDYQGAAPFTEAESQNVRSLCSDSPEVRWFLNTTVANIGRVVPAFHYTRVQNNPAKRDQTWDNSKYDGKRGGRGYAEYVDKTVWQDVERWGKLLARGAGCDYLPDFFHGEPVPGNLEEYVFANSLKKGKPVYSYHFCPSGYPQDFIAWEEAMARVASGIFTLCSGIVASLEASS